VSIEEGDAKAREFSVMFIETSAKAGFNIKVCRPADLVSLPLLWLSSIVENVDLRIYFALLLPCWFLALVGRSYWGEDRIQQEWDGRGVGDD